MPSRLVIVLIAFGLLLQGCSLQKRSLMPGWHVERIASVSAAPDEPAVVEANHTAVYESAEIHAASAGPLQDPLIPLKVLMAYAPSVEGVPELNALHISQPADAFETLPIASHEIERQQAKRHAIAPGGLIAALLYLLALGVISSGLSMFFLGLLFGNGLVVVLGLLLFFLAGFMIASAKDPRAEWRRRATERYRERLLNRVERSDERAEKQDELEANRAARQEELQLKEEQRRRRQEAEKQARKAKRQGFIQDPFVKIAFGFGAIIGLYLALF